MVQWYLHTVGKHGVQRVRLGTGTSDFAQYGINTAAAAAACRCALLGGECECLVDGYGWGGEGGC